MVGFKTERSEYYIDNMNKLVSGGIFRDTWHRFIRLQAIVGCNAIIVLASGKVIRTGIVKSYI